MYFTTWRRASGLHLGKKRLQERWLCPQKVVSQNLIGNQERGKVSRNGGELLTIIGQSHNNSQHDVLDARERGELEFVCGRSILLRASQVEN